MKCIAIDDEPIALSVIEQFCSRLNGVTLATFNNPQKGLDEVIRTRPDLLFLDIEMGNVSGVDIARRVPDGVCIIFTTAYAQFAIDGFDLGVVDFLHKPFSFPRFEKAVERARLRSGLLSTHGSNDESSGESITVSVEYRNVTIGINEITFIEAMDNYVKIYLVNSRTLLPQMSLKSIEELLPADQFLRIHKSYIVARREIMNYNRTTVTLKTIERQLPIGRSYLSTFQNWI